MLQDAEVSGIISNIKFPGTEGGPTTFKIYCPTIKKSFETVCDLFCPVRNNDIINAHCKYKAETNTLYITRSPFVQPAMDKESIVQCFMKALAKGYYPTMKIYNTFLAMVDNDDEAVIGLLTGLAQAWVDKGDPNILTSFGDSIDEDDLKKLLYWWHKERNMRRLYLFGMSKKEIGEADMTCDDIYQKCMKNPYLIPSISLDKADEILKRINKPIDSAERERGLILRVLWKNMMESGWTGTPSSLIVKQFPKIKEHIEILKSEYGVIPELHTVYLPKPNKIERYVSDFLISMVSSDPISYNTPLDVEIQSPIKKSGSESPKSQPPVIRHSAHYTRVLSEDQIKAVQGALDHTISIVTGGAGTGKTTCIKEIIHNLEIRKTTYAICAFTGKAVARIREVTGKRNACTIHRLISNHKGEGLPVEAFASPDKFQRSVNFAGASEGDITSRYDHIIIDEASMVTIGLFYDLIKAFPFVKKYTLVGDVNQLCPIEWGALFAQMVKSKTIPTYRLTTNHRVYQINGEKDGIILNANAIISHDPDHPFEFVRTTNFSLMDGNINRVFDIVKTCHTANIKISDITIITPYNRNLANLNKTVQSIYNTNPNFVSDSRGNKWMVGDKVMLNENDNEIGIFNGEEGLVSGVSGTHVTVNFGLGGAHDFLLEPPYSPTKKYNNDGDIEQSGFTKERTVLKLDFAYALTVDKSQGSEWDYVIFYIPPDSGDNSFLNKNRIYTAITRTKKCIWVIADTKLINKSSARSPAFRCDNLHKRLSDPQKGLPHMELFRIPPANQLIEMMNNFNDGPDFGYDEDDDL